MDCFSGTNYEALHDEILEENRQVEMFELRKTSSRAACTVVKVEKDKPEVIHVRWDQ